MKKYQMISALADETAKEVVRNEESWRAYLNTASRLYKYPFKEQLLIYAQKPDTSACASIEIWNETMHCWVNKGAKGIALLDEDNYQGLKYVFAIEDVHKARRIGRLPKLWEKQEEHEEAIIKRLERTYGETNENGGFTGRIREVAGRIAGDCYGEIAADMTYLTEDSFLEGLDEMNLQIHVRETLADSIAYTILKRCGMEEAELASEIDFPYIHEFNTTAVLSQLGSHVSDLSKPVLMEIGKVVAAHEKEQQRAFSGRQKENENSLEKGLANQADLRYNALKRESENHKEENQKDTGEGTEGSVQHDTGIREERGLSDSDVAGRRTAGGNTDQIRTDAEELPAGTQERSLHGTAPARETERAPITDSEPGRGENGTSDRSDDEERGSDRGTESSRSDEMGSENEPDQTLSRGSSTDRADLQLNTDTAKMPDSELSGISASEEPEPQFQQLSLFPSFEEQVGNVAAAQAAINYPKPAAFFLPQEQLETILRSGGGRDDSRKRIYGKYRQGKTPEEMTKILKEEYQTTGKGFELDGHPVSLWFDESGMRVGYGTSAKQAPVAQMDWSEIEQHIRRMVEEGSYMSSNEAFLVDAAERQRVASQLFFFFRDGMDVLPESLALKGGNYPESESHLMELLDSKEGAALISKELTIAKELLDSGERKLRWRHVKAPEYLLAEVAGFCAEKIEYPAHDKVEVRKEDFITQDEIDYRLTGGSGIEHGKFRIYEYFQQKHDVKDNIAFLKNEYGTGGSSHALPGSDTGHEDHDAKGIRLEKGSYGSPYAKILLKWNVVEKRIRELVEKDQYLTPEGKEAYASYRQEQAEQAMLREQERLEHGVRLECSKAIDAVIAEKYDGSTMPRDTAQSISSSMVWRECHLCLPIPFRTCPLTVDFPRTIRIGQKN